MGVKLTSIPSKFEIRKIIKRRRLLIKFHSQLYRKLLDLTGCNDNKQDIIDKYIRWCKLHFGIEPFNAILYMFYVRCKINSNDSVMKLIIDWLEDKHFIYNYHIKEFDFYDRFDSGEEALKWIISYRVTRLYFMNNFKDKNVQEESSCINI